MIPGHTLAEGRSRDDPDMRPAHLGRLRAAPHGRRRPPPLLRALRQGGATLDDAPHDCAHHAGLVSSGGRYLHDVYRRALTIG